jgi:hypothetical protein
MKNIALESKLTAENVRRDFKYDKETGELFRILRNSTLRKTGYFNPKISGTYVGYYGNVRITTIIWLLVHGKRPSGVIDHKDRNPRNNRLDNLREASSSQNAFNSKIHSNNKSGATGVSWRGVKWEARIGKDYKLIHIGTFDSFEDAKEAYDRKAKELFREFARS